jgi:hypothetical protein
LKNHHQNVYLEFKNKRINVRTNVLSANRKNTNKLNLGISKRIKKVEMKLKNTKCLVTVETQPSPGNIELKEDMVAEDEGDITNSDETFSKSTQDGQDPDSNETLRGHHVILDNCGNKEVEYSSLIMDPDQELGRKNIASNIVELVTNAKKDEANYSSKLFTQVFNRRGEKRSKCIICKKMFYNIGEGASFMLKHLKTKHAEVFNHDSIIKNEVGVVADVNDIYIHDNVAPFVPGEESIVVKEEGSDSKSKRMTDRKLSRCLLFNRKQVQGIKKPSLVWNFYTKMTEDTVQCKVCSKIYIARKGTTTSLMKHLRTSHLDYCIDWEKDHIALFDRKMMENDAVPQEHPIWKYYNYIEMGQYVCQLCDGKLLMSDHNTQLETFSFHLKMQHPTTFDECEYEKLILISRKKNDESLPIQDNEGTVVVPQTTFPLMNSGSLEQLENNSNLPDNLNLDNDIENLEHISVGLSNILAKDFFTHVHKEIVHCTLCSASTKAPKLGHNSSNLLWQHLKISHEDVYESLKEEKVAISESLKLESDKFPIWLHFKETTVNSCTTKGNSFTCLDCNHVLEISDMKIHPLEQHLSSYHPERHNQFQNDLQKDEVATGLEEMIDFTAKSGLTKVVKSFYKETVNKHGPVQCKQCHMYVEGLENPVQKCLVSHLKQNHHEILQEVFQKKRSFIDPEINEKVNIHLGECICEKCDQVIIVQ